MNEQPSIRVLGFKTEYAPARGDQKTRVIEWVEYAPISAIMTNRVWARVDHLRPPENGHIVNDDEGKKIDHMRQRWAMIEPAYKAWREGNEIPVSGTPLSVWPGLTQPQVAELQRLGIRTVEEVAAMTDTVVGKVPLPGARELPKQAKLFLENTDRARAADEMQARDEKIAALEEQLAAAMELLEQHAKPKGGVKTDKPKADAEQAA